MSRPALLVVLVSLGAGCLTGPLPGAGTDGTTLVLATTTSAYDTGFLDYIKDLYEAEAGVDLKVVAVGTGQALRLGRDGDADVLLVHDRAREDAFVESGRAPWRRTVMYNWFIVAGPTDDPAALKGRNVTGALRTLAALEAPFVSRGDGSGTHARELSLWTQANLNPDKFDSSWYIQSGAGMGSTLLVANERAGYVLTDDGTWWRYKSAGRLPGLEVAVERDPPLKNEYGVLPVAGPLQVEAEAFADWLAGPGGQAAVANFTVNDRRPFTPAGEDGAP